MGLIGSTTLGQACTAADTTLYLASATGVAKDTTMLRIESELVGVIHDPLTKAVGVMRGVGGTRAAAHASATAVDIATPDYFDQRLAMEIQNAPAYVPGNLNAGGNLGVTGTATVTGGLNVTGVTILSNTLTTASGGIILSSGAKILTGTGDPNTVVVAPNGSLYIRAGTSNKNTTLYVNTNGDKAWAAMAGV